MQDRSAWAKLDDSQPGSTQDVFWCRHVKQLVLKQLLLRASAAALLQVAAAQRPIT